MTDDGLEFAANENILASKSNRKMIFVGRGSQINSIVNTYPGQYALCTATGSGFTIDTIYERDAINTIWNSKRSIASANGESSEFSTTPVTDTTQINIVNIRCYAHLTLPTTYKYFIITGITWKNEASPSGNIICGVDILDANPPVSTKTISCAVGAAITQAGPNAEQRCSQITSNFIRGGTHVGGWVNKDTSTPLRFAAPDGTNVNQNSTYTAATTSTHDSAWSAGSRAYLKIHYRGYTPV